MALMIDERHSDTRRVRRCSTQRNVESSL